MSITKRLGIAQLAVMVVAGIYQAAAHIEQLTDTAAGTVIGYVFLLLTLAVFGGALLKAYDNRQFKWLAAMVFFWPSMYLFIFKYAKPSRY